MKRELKGYAVRADDDGGVVFLASSPQKALDGWSIPTDAWDTTYFDRIGAPLLYGHDYTRPPIGKVTKLERTKAGLVAHTAWDMQDPFAAEIYRKVKAEWLNCCSVGFDIIEQEGAVVSRASLLELSVVPLPSDANAVVLARSAFTDETPFEDPSKEAVVAADPVTTTPDPKRDPSARASWPESAAAMARLFQPFAQRPDAEREADYKRVVREYARHGKTPPEFLPQAELDALPADAVRAHFLEGEPELCADVFSAMASRAGAVLSQRNLDDLQKAGDLITGVIARAKKDAEQTDAERAAEDDLRKLHRLFNPKKDESE